MKTSAPPAVATVAPIANWRNYIPLTKPTVTLLVVVTVVPALLLAANGLPHLVPALAALIGTYLSSASASVFNHILDSDVDLRMTRTRGRPVACGKISQNAALAFGSVLGFISLLLLYVYATPLAAVVAFSANVFYVLGYTLCLKRYTSQNIVIGGAAGAVGPLIGWAAVTGTLGWPAWTLFAIIFLWTPPHFWSLAIKYKKDYAAAGIPMLPVVKGDEATRRQIFWYTLTLFPPVIALYYFGAANGIYLATSVAATGWFSWKAWQLLASKDNLKAMPVFHYSCLYLFIVVGGLTVDRLVAGLF